MATMADEKQQKENAERAAKFTPKDFKAFKAAIEMCAASVKDIPRTDFVVVAVHRSEDNEKGMGAIYTNLHTKDDDGNLEMPTIGMITDLVVEARLEIDESEFFEKRWSNDPPASEVKPS